MWSGTLGDVSAPIVIHRLSDPCGRRMSLHSHGRDEILGTTYSDHDLVVFLEAAGVHDPDSGPAHPWSAA